MREIEELSLIVEDERIAEKECVEDMHKTGVSAKLTPKKRKAKRKKSNKVENENSLGIRWPILDYFFGNQ